MWPFLQHLFTPHHTNNHRPRVLHPQAFIFYIVFFIFLQLSFSAVKNTLPQTLGLATDINVDQLLRLTNQKRIENNLSPLGLDTQLSEAAANKANDMFNKDYWAHNSPDGLTPWVFIKSSGYSYIYAGENLAKNFGNSDGVVNAWMASPSHRANMLKAEYQDVGFAVVNGRLNGEETTLVVQVFGTKQKSSFATVSSPKPPLAVFPSITLTPAPTVRIIGSNIEQSSRSAVSPVSAKTLFASSQKNPLFDIFALTKNTALTLIIFLMLILTLDALLVWRRRIVRSSGHNFAHLLFFMMVVGVFWIIQPGVIH